MLWLLLPGSVRCLVLLLEPRSVSGRWVSAADPARSLGVSAATGTGRPVGDRWTGAATAVRVGQLALEAVASWGVGRRDRAGDDWQRRLQAHNETFTFLADIGLALIKSIRARPAGCWAGCLGLATGAPAAARWRPGHPSAPARCRTRRLGPQQVSGSQPTGSR